MDEDIIESWMKIDAMDSSKKQRDELVKTIKESVILEIIREKWKRFQEEWE